MIFHPAQPDSPGPSFRENFVSSCITKRDPAVVTVKNVSLLVVMIVLSIVLGLSISSIAILATILCAWQRRSQARDNALPTRTSNTSIMEPAFSKITGQTTSQISGLLSIHTDGWAISSSEIELGDRLGAGSYGEVLQGRWRGTDVAVKTCHEKDLFSNKSVRDEFEMEVQMLSSMRHPHILNFLGAVVEGNKLSIVTELMPRGSLFKVLNNHSIEIDPRRRLRMALDIARGMNHLHSHNPPIVHRDLKSPNLLLAVDWTVKVADFGTSRVMRGDCLSTKGDAGTTNWMSPEVLRGDTARISEKCDIWSYGVILYEIVTREKPWRDLTAHQIMYKVTMEGYRLKMPDGVQPEITALVNDCWNEEPSLRPSFSNIIDRLSELKAIYPPDATLDSTDLDGKSSAGHPSSRLQSATGDTEALTLSKGEASSKGGDSSKDPNSQPASLEQHNQHYRQGAIASTQAPPQLPAYSVSSHLVQPTTNNPFFSAPSPTVNLPSDAPHQPANLTASPFSAQALDPAAQAAAQPPPPALIQPTTNNPFILSTTQLPKPPSSSSQAVSTAQFYDLGNNNPLLQEDGLTTIAPDHSSQLGRSKHPSHGLTPQPSSLITSNSSRNMIIDRLLQAEAMVESQLRMKVSISLKDLKRAQSHFAAIEMSGGGAKAREEAKQRVIEAMEAKNAAEEALANIVETKNMHRI